jgi:hypothetical protein
MPLNDIEQLTEKPGYVIKICLVCQRQRYLAEDLERRIGHVPYFCSLGCYDSASRVVEAYRA